MQRPPAIPRIEDPDLLSVVSALTRAADILRHVLVNLVEAEPAVMAALAEHQDVLIRADAVINAFVEYMNVNGPKE